MAKKSTKKAFLKSKNVIFKKIKDKDIKALIHEVEVHQAELEIQNEQLRMAQQQIEESRNKYVDLYDFSPIGYFTLDKHGLILEANLAGAQMLGIERSRLVKKAFALHVHDEDKKIFFLHLKKVFESGTKQMCELAFKKKSSGWFHTRLESIAIADASGIYNTCRIAISDITEQKQSEEEIRHLASFPQLSPNPVLEVSSSGEIIFHNSAVIQVLRDLKLNEDVSTFLPEDIKVILKALKQKKDQQFYREVKIKEKIFRETIYLTPQFAAVRIYAIDVTEHKRDEEKLLKAHEKLELRVRERTAELKRIVDVLEAERQRFVDVLDQLPAYVVLLTPDYHVPFANRFFRERFGESQGKRCFEYLFNRTEPCEICETYKVLKTNAPLHWDWIGPDGRNYNIYDFPFTDVDGSQLIMEVGLDITERKKTEEELRHTEEKYRSIYENIIEGIFQTTPDGRYISANPALARMLGYESPESLLAEVTDISRIYVDPVRRSDFILLMEAYDSITGFESQVYRKDGNIIWISENARAIRNESRKILHYEGTVEDITERKETEKRVNANNALLKLFAQTFSRKEYLNKTVELIENWSGCRNVGIRVLDEEGNIPYESFTGFSKTFMESENFLSVKRDMCACIRVVTGRLEPQDATVITPGGSFYCNNTFKFVSSLSEEEKARFRGMCIKTGYASVAVVPIRYRGEMLGAIHLADEREGKILIKDIEFIEAMSPLIGEAIFRFNVEDKLMRSKASLAEAQRVAHLGNWEWDIQTNKLYWSDEIYRIFGLIPQQESVTYNEFLNYIHPDDREFVEKAVKEALYGKPYSIDHRVVLPDGKMRIVHEQGEVTFGESGEPIQMVGTVQDITEKKENELRLIMSERLSALGQMASGIAHEINNPLASIGGCTEGLLNRINRGQVDHELFKNYLKIIDEEVERCKNITTNMLSFVRKGTYTKSYVNVHEILDKTLELINLQGRLKEVNVLRNYGEGFPLIQGSEGDLKQVFLAVINNALDSMNDNGTLTLETGKENSKIFIKIVDTGSGIPSDLIGRIFNPFFTTKSEKGGVGLGLSIADKIITDNDGRIDVISEEEKGTTFTITLPI